MVKIRGYALDKVGQKLVRMGAGKTMPNLVYHFVIWYKVNICRYNTVQESQIVEMSLIGVKFTDHINPCISTFLKATLTVNSKDTHFDVSTTDNF